MKARSVACFAATFRLIEALGPKASLISSIWLITWSNRIIEISSIRPSSIASLMKSPGARMIPFSSRQRSSTSRPTISSVRKSTLG